MDSYRPVPGIPDATARRVTQIPAPLADATHAGTNAVARRGALLFAPPGTGSFLARDGTVIEFALEADADEGLVALYLNGTARGALIHQRGELPLHATTLVPPGGETAIALCGPSGAGKSTLGAALIARGWTLVADDTTRLTRDGTSVLAWPSRDSIKLWRDACERVGADPATLAPIAGGIDKYYLPVTARRTPVALSTIVELSPGPVGSDTLSAGERMTLVSRNTYRLEQVGALGVQAEHVAIVAHVAGMCRVLRFANDRSQPIAATADALERAVG